MDVPHFGQRFDPRPGTRLATRPDELGRQSRAAVRRMEHDPRQHGDLGIEGRQLHRRPAARQSKEFRARPETFGRRREDTDADRLVAMPEDRDPSDEADVMAAVMPASKVRPVAFRSGRKGDVAGKADDFFFTPSKPRMSSAVFVLF